MRRVGLPVLVTQSTYTVGEDFTGAAAVVSDLGEPGQPFSVVHGEAHGHRWSSAVFLVNCAHAPPVTGVPASTVP